MQIQLKISYYWPVSTFIHVKIHIPTLPSGFGVIEMMVFLFSCEFTTFPQLCNYPPVLQKETAKKKTYCKKKTQDFFLPGMDMWFVDPNTNRIFKIKNVCTSSEQCVQRFDWACLIFIAPHWYNRNISWHSSESLNILWISPSLSVSSLYNQRESLSQPKF